jgi:hypothetical protein
LEKRYDFDSCFKFKTSVNGDLRRIDRLRQWRFGGGNDRRVHAASHSADVSDFGRKSVTLDPQEQARRLIIGTSSVGITPVDNIAVAGHMPSNSDALSAGSHSGNIDAQKIARRMLTGQGAL